MMLGTRLRTWAVGATETATLPQVACVEAGHALLLHLEGHLNPRAVAFARMIAPDPNHTVVVADVPPDGPIELWHAVATLLGKRRGGYRLVLGRHSRDAAVMTGQWLAERLNRTVLVPDGDVAMGAGGTLFSSALYGTGWVKFRRGRAPQQDSRRFPAPGWTFPGTEQIWQPGPVSVVEPVPAGVWIRPLESADDQRHLLISGMLTQPDLLTVVLGSPNSRPVPLGEIARFCYSVPPETRDKLRFIQYGPVDVLRSSVGQALADTLGAAVTFYTGMPTPEGTLHVVGPDGKLGWRSFARELRYLPRAAAAGRIPPPQVIAHDNPMPGASQLSPGVYWYAVDAVVEIVQSGLWLRPPVAPVDADYIRTAPIDPRHASVVFDTTSRQTAERMQMLAGELIAMLDPAMQRMFRVLPAAVLLSSRNHVPSLPPAPARGTVVQTVPGRWSAPSESSVQFPVDTSVELMSPTMAFPALPPIGLERKEIEAVVVPSAPVVEVEDAEEVPAVEAPVLEAPVLEAPVLEAPVVEAPAVEAPVVEVPAVEAPRLESLTVAMPVVAAAAAAPEVVEPEPAVVVAPPVAEVEPAAMPAGLRLESAVPDFGMDFAVVEVPAPAATAAILEPEPPVQPEPEPVPVAVAEPTPATAEPEAVLVQPVPASAACAVPPARGLSEERAWMRKTLGTQYDVASSTVSRMLSQVPGLRVGMQADEVLADLVAVRLYLTGDSAGVDEAVRSAAPGPHVPLARCVSSGLRRLPSYRGATQLWAVAGPSQLDWYRERTLVSEWAFLTATTAGRTAQPGEVEFRIWSMTARRTQLIAPDVADQVLFAPGTNFKVLDVREEPTPVVLLRELSTAEIGEDGQVNTGRSMFDDLALGGLDQAAQAWAQVAGTAADRPTASAPPGLLSARTGRTTA